MTRRPVFFALVCLSLGLAMALAACGQANPALPSDSVPSAEQTGTPASEQPASPPGEPIEIAVDLGAPPSTLDPALVAPLDVAGRDLVENLFVGLTYLNPESGQIEPALAESWEVSSDGLTWTFHLRDDVFWARVDPESGEAQALRPVVATDAVHALTRACRADFNAPGIPQTLFIVRGCRDVYTQDPAMLTPESIAETLGVRAPDETTVEYSLEREAAHFLTMTSMPIMRPVPPELTPEPTSAWTDLSVIWASGPWIVAEGELPDRLTLIANPTWPLDWEGNVTRVEVTFGGKAGADFGPAGGGDEPQLLAQPVVAFLAFSFEQPPAHDEHVRRALAAAVDRERLVAGALGPDQHALPLTGIIPPGTALAPDNQPPGYDAEYAQSELAEAGYPDCRGLPPLALMVDSSDTSQRVGESLVAMWEETLGCRVGTITVDAQPYQDVGAAAQNVPPPTPTPAPPEEQPDKPIIRAEVILRYWQADYPDANNWTADILGCATGFPGAYLRQARDCGPVDRVLQGAMTTYEAEARADLYREVEAQLFGPESLTPVVPLYVQVRAVQAEPWLTIWPDRAGPLRFDAWLVDEEARP